MKKILVTKKLPFDVKSEIKGYNLVYNESDKSLTYDELSKKIVDVDGIISMLSDRIDSNLLKKAKKLKVIANYAVGYNNIDIKTAKSMGIAVFNTPDVLTESTAELGFALMMSVSRRIVESDMFARSGAFEGWSPTLFLGRDLHRKTLGIFGFGRIGQAVARCASGFNMDIIYYNRSRKFNAELLTGVKKVEFDKLLKESDFLIICAPLNEDTKFRFTYEEFKKMKKSAVFVNIGRGEIVKESDLARALKENLIFGAGLDVFEKEPEINSELFNLDNVIILPHIGSAEVDTRAEMAKLCINSIKLVFENNINLSFNNRIC
jgi:lactate dehydrogenase-like 2-hydroxyacid dehydrogenase